MTYLNIKTAVKRGAIPIARVHAILKVSLCGWDRVNFQIEARA